MPRPGGEADKLGNLYESIWTVDAVLGVFEGKSESITCESLGEESKGVEFHIKTTGGKLQFHSVKRQKTGGDWSVSSLCTTNKKGNSVLGDLVEKFKNYNNAKLCFVSSTGANQLRELTERAASLDTLADFQKALSSSSNLLSLFDNQIISLCNSDEELAYQMLQSLEVVLISQKQLTHRVDQRIELLFYNKNRSKLVPGTVRHFITEFVLDNLGRTITTQEIRELVDSKEVGHQDWKTNLSVNEAVSNVNSRYISIVESELINSKQIPRPESREIAETVSNNKSQGVLLVAPGGYGKSCVLSQALNQLSAKNIPYIVVRMDSVSACKTPRQLGKQLDLPKSPAVVLAGIANNDPSVLVIDQLDAMSIVSGRNPELWEVFRHLCDEVDLYPHMKMIMVCRDFDLNNDWRLRSLNSQDQFTTVTLGKLSKQDIDNSLVKADRQNLQLNNSQLEILSIPFNLLLFLQGTLSEDFTSVSELYDHFWERKQHLTTTRLDRSCHWNAVLNALTKKMSDDRALFAPICVVDKWIEDVRAMISEHVLDEIPNSKQIRFFHESFFDYAYARDFCSRSESVVEFLGSTEQHLFRRSQVRQILTHKRGSDFKGYIHDIHDILKSNEVRFHIKRMVVSGFHQIGNPKVEEWSELKPYLIDDDLSRYVTSALSHHVGWFDLLDRLGVFKAWLSSNDEALINTATSLLESLDLLDARSSRIALLITPYIALDDTWFERIMRIMSWGNAHKSDEMASIYLGLIERGAFNFRRNETGRDLWRQLHTTVKESPKFVIDVSATWFNSVLKEFDDGLSMNFLDECNLNHSDEGARILRKATENEPEYFVEKMLPLVISTVLKTEVDKERGMINRLWPFLTNIGDPSDIDEAILLLVKHSLQYLAKNKVELFRKQTLPMVKHPHDTFAYLLLQSWTENPQEFADECVEYLLVKKSRLSIGYHVVVPDHDKGSGTCAVSRLAIQGATQYCSINLSNS